MHDRRKLLRRRAANALRRRIRGDELRVGGLELTQLEHQPVVCRVRDLGIVEHVIAIVVVRDLGTQLVDAPGGLACCHRVGSGAAGGPEGALEGDHFLAQLEYPLDAQRSAALVLELPAQAMGHCSRRVEQLVEGIARPVTVRA